MIKIVTLLKRKAGLSKGDFVAYYESHHRGIGEKVLSGFAVRYFRRYLHPADGVDQDCDFDVVMEIWFPDQARREAWIATLSDPALMAEIVADEEKLFDRSRIRTFTYDESESDLPAVG